MEISKKLTKQEEIEIMQRYQIAYKSNNIEEIKAIMTIVWENIHKYITSYYIKAFNTYFSKTPDDMMNEAYIEIHKQFYKYNATKGVLITWARPHIHHAAQLYIDSNYARTTAHYAQNIKKINNEISKANKIGVTLTDDEISENTKIPLSTLKKCKEIIQNTNMIHIESNDYNSNLIPGQLDSPETSVIAKEETEEIRRCIELLSSDEKRIILCKYGFESGFQMNNTEISKKLNIPKENIRKIATKAERALTFNLKSSSLFTNRIIQSDMKNTFSDIIFIPYDKKESMNNKIEI